MFEPAWSVLVVSLNRRVCERITNALPSPEYEVRCAPDVTHAQELTEKEVFDLVLLEFPAPGSNLREFLKTLRSFAWASREAAVVFLTAPEALEEAEAFQAGGVTRILSIQAAEKRLRTAIREILVHEQRFPVRALVRITGQDAGMAGTVMAQTENLSRTGMLVRCDKPIAIGGHFGFTLELPGQPKPVRGQAAVVRYSRAAFERVEGFAARFVSFEDDGEGHLETFIEQERKRPVKPKASK
jgi:CheY-like chemotaxis protein